MLIRREIYSIILNSSPLIGDPSVTLKLQMISLLQQERLQEALDKAEELAAYHDPTAEQIIQ